MSGTAGAKMLQETVTFDLRHMSREPSTSTELYILFLLAVSIVGSVKLIRVWRAAPPFKLSRQANSPTYLQLLATARTSLKHWIALTFLGWGLFASVNLSDVCNRLFDENTIRRFVILFVIQDFSTTLTMALLVMTFLFLVRWHIVKRIEHLR
jgi:hypothetical protein